MRINAGNGQMLTHSSLGMYCYSNENERNLVASYYKSVIFKYSRCQPKSAAGAFVGRNLVV